MATMRFEQVQRFILVKKYLGVRGTLRSIVICNNILEWARVLEGRVLNKFFNKLGRANPALFSTGGGAQFFCTEKITRCCFYLVYTSKVTSQD